MSSLKNTSQTLLQKAEEFYSHETSLVHLSYEKRPFVRGDSAPLYHNFLYALILLRTKERQNMEKGMDLIGRLLEFQIVKEEFSGNFPRYIHEYPQSFRKFEVVDILLVFYWIYHDFFTIFPKPLKEKFSASLKASLAYLESLVVEGCFSYSLKMQIACLFEAYGQLFDDEQKIETGQKMLKALFAKGVDQSWGSIRALSKIMLFTHLLDLEKWQADLEPLFNFMGSIWHEKLQAHVGAGLNEHYYEDQQERLLYDAFMSESNQLFKADAFEISLLNSNYSKNLSQKRFSKYALEGFNVEQRSQDDFAVSLFNLPEELWEKRGGFYPLKILLKKSSGYNSFVVQMGSFVDVQALSDRCYQLTFSNAAEELDISFFTNLSSEVKITSKNHLSTLFDLSAPIEFQFESKIIKMTFVDYDPSRNIWAHLCQDNRKSQLVKAFNHTYDWHLYFRKTKSVDLEPLKIQIEILDAK